MFPRIKKTITEYRELIHLAYHDYLTGLLNRNWLHKNADKIKFKYVYFIDINDLHEINKNGHTFGDLHIKKVVSIILDKGLLIRYAGDEFILFSNSDNTVSTNDLFSVGKCIVGEDVWSSINIADKNMIREKEKYKTMRNNEKRF